AGPAGGGLARSGIDERAPDALPAAGGGGREGGDRDDLAGSQRGPPGRRSGAVRGEGLRRADPDVADDRAAGGRDEDVLRLRPLAEERRPGRRRRGGAGAPRPGQLVEGREVRLVVGRRRSDRGRAHPAAAGSPPIGVACRAAARVARSMASTAKTARRVTSTGERRAPPGAPVASAKIVSPSCIVWTGRIVRARPSWATEARWLACSTVSRAAVATTASVVCCSGGGGSKPRRTSATESA